MNRLLGSILAGLLALQTGLPLAGLDLSNAALAAAELVVGVAVASLAFYLNGASMQATRAGRPR